MKKIAVIIVTFNSEKHIQKCVVSLLNQNWNQEIIIIDNNSSDNTVGVLKSANQKDITVLENKKNTGFAAAVNQGLRYVMKNLPNMDCFFLLNPDAYLEKDCLKKLVAGVTQNKKVGLASPLIINPSSQKPWFSGANINWTRLRTIHSPTHYSSASLASGLLTTHYLSGCALLIKKEVIEKIGFFDERFFLYYEDADFSLRARKAGHGLKIIPEAICFHQESQSSDSKTKTYHLVKSGLMFFHKHYPSWAIPWFWIIFWLRFFYHRLISKKQPVYEAMKKFLSETK